MSMPIPIVVTPMAAARKPRAHEGTADVATRVIPIDVGVTRPRTHVPYGKNAAVETAAWRAPRGGCRTLWSDDGLGRLGRRGRNGLHAHVVPAPRGETRVGT